MDELDRHRALADRRGDALDRAGAHVARGEHARAAGLEQERLPPRASSAATAPGPAPSGQSPWRRSRSPAAASRSAASAPMKLNSAGVLIVRASPVLLLTSSTSLRWPSPCMPPDFGVEQHLDVGRLLDAVGQVARHVLVQVVAADHEVDFAGLPGEEDGGLSGGVAAADDDHVRTPAHLRLDRRRGVVDAAALEPLAAFDVQQAVVGAGGDQQALGRRPSRRRRGAAPEYALSNVRPVTWRRRRAGCAPNLLACTTARSASSPPVMPVGKPR